MKNLKITLFLFTALLTYSQALAQDCGITYSASTFTAEISQYQTSFTVNAWTRHVDSIKFTGMPCIDSNAWFTLNSFTQPDTSLWYDGDSLNFTYTLLADTNHLSYYAQKVAFSQAILLKDGRKDVIQWNAWVYFTPWRTIEIWNEEDYYGGDRS